MTSRLPSRYFPVLNPHRVILARGAEGHEQRRDDSLSPALSL
jgi:hypothetical protein